MVFLPSNADLITFVYYTYIHLNYNIYHQVRVDSLNRRTLYRAKLQYLLILCKDKVLSLNGLCNIDKTVTVFISQYLTAILVLTQNIIYNRENNSRKISTSTSCRWQNANVLYVIWRYYKTKHLFKNISCICNHGPPTWLMFPLETRHFQILRNCFTTDTASATHLRLRASALWKISD